MSEVVIFQEITTDTALFEIEEAAKKYDGLYVDMDKADQRKYVKEQASTITGILKKLDRARIDKSKAYKQSVEAEAKLIRERLELANKPFTLLIDEHKEKRARILAAEKAAQEAIEQAAQLEEDHEAAIMEDKARTFEKAEAVRLQKERDEQIAKEAKEQAEKAAAEAIEQAEAAKKQAELDAIQAKKDAEENARLAAEHAEREKQAAILAEQQRQEAEKQREADELAAREADKDHKRSINNAAKAGFIGGGFTEEQAILAVKLIANNRIQNVTINY